MANLEELRDMAKGQNAMPTLEELRDMAKGQNAQPSGLNYLSGLARSGGQGFAFGFGDEIEAAVRSLGKREYADLLQDVRGEIKKFESENPKAAITSEITGAVLPTLVATILTGGFGGGAGAATTTARLAAKYPRIANVIGANATSTLIGGGAVGAAQGAITGAGKNEGGFNNLGELGKDVVYGTGFGTVSGLGGQIAGGLLSYVLGGVSRRLGNKASSAVENEVKRLAQENGITPDKVIEGIYSGKMMSENKTLLDAVRLYAAEGGPAAAKLKETITSRPAQTKGAAMGAMSDDLSTIKDTSILENMRLGELAAKEAEDLAYGRLTQQVTPDAEAQLLDTMARTPNASKEVNIADRARIDPNAGVVQDLYTPPNIKKGESIGSFRETPTVGQAEKIRRAVGNTASRFFKSDGMQDAGSEIAGQERILRSVLDETSEGLKLTRSQAALNRAQREAFKDGRKAINKSSDEMEIEYRLLREESGDASVVQAYREGVMQSIREKAEKRGGSALMRRLSDESDQYGKNLRQVVSDDAYSDIVNKLGVAEGAQDLYNKVIPQSQTANVLAQSNRAGSSALDTASALGEAAIGNPLALFRILPKNSKNSFERLSDKQKEKVVEILTSLEPRVVAEVLKDENIFINIIEKVAPSAVKRASNIIGSQELGPAFSGLLSSITGGQQ